MPRTRTLPAVLSVATVAAALVAAVPGDAQSARPRSPEVLPDHRVTFRLRAPSAKEVFLAREGAPREAMVKDEAGVWSLTTGPLEPDFYGYSFVVDGTGLIDPNNPLMKPNLLNTTSMVHVPGPSSLPWETNPVPHGTVHHHYYHSGVVGDDRDFYVYTPPGYDPSVRKNYPVLYLLHGYSDDASGWSAVGRANVILDNLIAEHKARPMLVVMPLGYGTPEIVTPGASRTPDSWQRNAAKFGEALIREVIPEVEKSYRVSRERNDRAIAGLSMGGAESLLVGLNHPDRFGWVGSFSAGGLSPDFDADFPKVADSSTPRPHLLWIACGTEDGLLQLNRSVKSWLKGKSVAFTDVETPGAHSWMVWRRNLAAFAPLLFRSRER